MEDDLRRELPVVERRGVAVADAAAAAVVRQAAPVFLVRLLERVEPDQRQQQLVVRLVHLALEYLLRVQVHPTLRTDTFIDHYDNEK